MTIEVRVPQLPESVADATLVSWHKQPGDAVARDENLVDLETDKVVLEVPAPAGRRSHGNQAQADGTTVTSGQVLALIEDRAREHAPKWRQPAAGARGHRRRGGRRPCGAQTESRRQARGRRRTSSIPRRLPAPAATGASRNRTW